MFITSNWKIWREIWSKLMRLALVQGEVKVNAVSDDLLWQQPRAGLSQLWNSSSQTSWLKMVLFPTKDPIIFVFYPVCRSLDPVAWWEVPEHGSSRCSGGHRGCAAQVASGRLIAAVPSSVCFGDSSHFIHSCFPLPVFRMLEFTGRNNMSSVWQWEVFLSTPMTS